MFKYVKILLAVILAVISLIVIAVGILVLVVDPNNYKPQLENLVLEKTGMTLLLPGKISWSFWPVVGVKTTALSLSLSKNNKASDLIALDDVDIGLLPWSVMSGELSYVFLKASSVAYGNFLVKNMSLEVNHFRLNQPFALNFKGLLEKGLAMPLSVSFESSVRIDLASSRNDSASGVSVNNTGVLSLKNIQAKFNRSLVTGEVSLQNFEKPVVEANLNSDSFEVSDFVNLKGAKLALSDWAFKTHLTLAGTTQSQVPSTLKGSLQMTVKKTVLKGVDIGQALAKIRQVLSGVFGGSSSANSAVGDLSSLPDLMGLLSKNNSNPNSNPNSSWINMKNGGETELGAFNLDAVVQNGVIQNAALLLNGDHFQVKGSGMIDLNQQSINYRFSIYGMHENTPDKYLVPFLVTGALSDPKMGLDYAALNSQLRQIMQDQAKNALVQKISASVPNIQGLVTGLLGQ